MYIFHEIQRKSNPFLEIQRENNPSHNLISEFSYFGVGFIRAKNCLKIFSISYLLVIPQYPWNIEQLAEKFSNNQKCPWWNMLMMWEVCKLWMYVKYLRYEHVWRLLMCVAGFRRFSRLAHSTWILLHNGPAGRPQDHCERCRVRSLDRHIFSLVHYYFWNDYLRFLSALSLLDSFCYRVSYRCLTANNSLAFMLDCYPYSRLTSCVIIDGFE